MKKIKFLILAALAVMSFVSCSKDDDDKTINNIVSEYSYNDSIVAATKAKSGNTKAVLLIAFGSTWNNAFEAFDATKTAYEQAFPGYDVYFSFSSDICINRASKGEHVDEKGDTIRRDYYEPRYLLHAIGASKYSEIRVQSLQVIPGEEFANVVAAVKKFMNNGYIASAHLDDSYLAKLQDDEAIYLGMPLLNDPDTDVPSVAQKLIDAYKSEAADGVVAFMGHGNPDKYDTFKANVRYTQLETALQTKSASKNYYVGTVDMSGNYKNNVCDRIKANGVASGKVHLHALMSIAGDHAHNDMAGVGDSYWNEKDPASEENSWYEYFNHNGFTSSVTVNATTKEPQGLLELSTVRQVWIDHTKNAEPFEDAYHSMYPESEE